jgi:hypothetical protein
MGEHPISVICAAVATPLAVATAPHHCGPCRRATLGNKAHSPVMVVGTWDQRKRIRCPRTISLVEKKTKKEKKKQKRVEALRLFYFTLLL